MVPELKKCSEQELSKFIQKYVINKNLPVSEDKNSLQTESARYERNKLIKVERFKNKHTNRFVCRIYCRFANCNKVFKKWQNVLDHLRMHTNERPFQCTFPDCGAAFTQRANLYKHGKVHRPRASQ